jgi:cell division septation protein DedD
VPAGQPPSSPPATPPEEELSYYSRLEGDGKTGQPAKSAPPSPAANESGTPAKDPKTQKAIEEPKAKPLPPAPAAVPPTIVNGEPPGKGYALRVAAYKDKAQADSLAGRLSAKGYSTYIVQTPATKGPGLFSVRVGKYKTQKEVNAVKRRLEKEEKLKPSPIPR